MNTALRANYSPAPRNCGECAFLSDCGGWDDHRRDEGCFQRCLACFTSPCDCTCPLNTVLFDRSVEEVRGLSTMPSQFSPPQSPPSSLPIYLPQIYHGSGRSHPLTEPWVAIPLHYVCRLDKRGRIDLLFDSRRQLCERLKIHEDANLVLTAVSPDRFIEAFWEHHKRMKLLKRIAEWEVAGMTTPNYSFTNDTPRTNSLWNLARIFRMVEFISNNGIPAIPHLNALTRSDWKKWERFCTEFPTSRIFSMEFQTGLGKGRHGSEARDEYLRNFGSLQDSCGGRIHPIVLAGAGKMRELAGLCQTFSIVDSTPFIKTEKRQRLRRVGNRMRWLPDPTNVDDDLSKRLQESISLQRTWVLQKNGLQDPGLPLYLPAA
jgi:hypothetical protein